MAHTEAHGTTAPHEDTEQPAQPPLACGSSGGNQALRGAPPSPGSEPGSERDSHTPWYSQCPSRPAWCGCSRQGLTPRVTSRPGAGPWQGIGGHPGTSAPAQQARPAMQTGSCAGRSCATWAGVSELRGRGERTARGAELCVPRPPGALHLSLILPPPSPQLGQVARVWGFPGQRASRRGIHTPMNHPEGGPSAEGPVGQSFLANVCPKAQT